MFEEVLGVALGCLKVYLRAQSMMVDFLNITLGLDQGVTIRGAIRHQIHSFFEHCSKSLCPPPPSF